MCTILALFKQVEDASRAVSSIIPAGIIPAALEMMDGLAIEAVEAGSYPVGYPEHIKAVLLIELDGLAAGLRTMSDHILHVCRDHHVDSVNVAESAQERARWWSNRKTAFGASGCISPDYIVQDGVIPRSKLSEVLAGIQEISEETDLRIANVFHAGDGNLHPLILFDSRIPGQTELAIQTGSRVLQVCADVGGSITGEHGVGLEKQHDMHMIFSAEDLQAQLAIRDVFNPEDLCNPGKLFPKSERCVEVKHAHPH